jgi:hypothetical protein
VGEQPVERKVKARKLALGGDTPGLRQRAGQVGFLVEQLGGAVAHAPGLDQQHLGPGAEQIEQRVLALGQPWQPGLHAIEGGPLRQALPVLTAPGLLGDELRRPLANVVGWEEFTAREELGAFDVDG